MLHGCFRTPLMIAKPPRIENFFLMTLSEVRFGPTPELDEEQQAAPFSSKTLETSPSIVSCGPPAHRRTRPWRFGPRRWKLGIGEFVPWAVPRLCAPREVPGLGDPSLRSPVPGATAGPFRTRTGRNKDLRTVPVLLVAPDLRAGVLGLPTVTRGAENQVSPWGPNATGRGPGKDAFDWGGPSCVFSAGDRENHVAPSVKIPPSRPSRDLLRTTSSSRLTSIFPLHHHGGPGMKRPYEVNFPPPLFPAAPIRPHPWSLSEEVGSRRKKKGGGGPKPPDQMTITPHP